MPPAAPSLKRFLSSIGLVVVLNALVKPGWLLLENMVQDQLGHATFGLIAAMSSLTIIISSVADLGLTQSSVRRAASEADFLQGPFRTVLPLRGLLNGVALLAMLAVGWLMGYRGQELGLLVVVGTALLLTQYTQFLRGIFQGQQQFSTDAVLSVLEKGLLMAAVGGLLLAGPLTLWGYLNTRLAVAIFTTLLLYGLMLRFFGRVPYRWQWTNIRSALRLSLPFALIYVLYGLNERVDMVMLERLSSAKEAGYYVSAYRWMDAAMMYAWTVLPLFFARFAHAQQQPGELNKLLGVGQRLVAVPLFFVVAFVLFRGEEVFWQFKHSSGPELERMAWCLKLLFVNVLANAFFAIYSTVLTSIGHERAVSWTVAASVALNIGLNLLLMPQYGAIAGAANTLACVCFVSLTYLWLVHRRTTVSIPWGLLARLLLALGLLCGGWWMLRWTTYLDWLVETTIMAVVFGFIVLGTGLLRWREMSQLLKRK